MSRNAPIGIFDSGMGGLSVWRELRRELPCESVVYLADGKNCPYGERSAEEIASLTRAAVEELLARGAKLIIVACNTATAMAIDMLRKDYDIPFVGMEPAVKPAALSSRSGVIGILATQAALAGGLFRATSARYSSQVEILSAVGEGFVEVVEQGAEESPEAESLVRRVLEPMIEAGADRIVLGCTHYPFLEGCMRRVIGTREVELVNPAPAVVRRAKWLLEQSGELAEEGHKAELSFVTFADDEYLARLKARATNIDECR